jgi:hypothetical protein
LLDVRVPLGVEVASLKTIVYTYTRP